jgi:hypothetical protein
MRRDAGETIEASRLELLRRASIHGDHEAWTAFQQSLEETVLAWFHDHPGSEAVCRMQSERYFVALAFERLRQAVVQRQVACETFSGMLVYLRVSLNGAILETLRVSDRTGEVSRPGTGEPHMEDHLGSRETWDMLQTLLPGQREQRLAYLLYHCGLKPREVVRCCPQEWRDIQEIYYLRRIILERLLRHANQLSEQFDQ